MRFNLKSLIYLPLIFFFFPAFSFYFPITKAIYNFYYISLMFAIFLMFIFDYKSMIKKISLICRKTPLIYFIMFFIGVCLTSFIASIIGLTTIKQTCFSLLLRYILAIIPILVYYICLIGKYISYKTFIRYFIFMFWLNAVFGIVAYIGRWFDINIINFIFDFLNNRRIIGYSLIGAEDGTARHYFEGFRLTGLYEEPGFLGQFLCIFLPFIYSFSYKNFKISKSNKLNIIILITIIPLVWINIILTLSPISLVLGLIITFIYYFYNILQFIKKYLLIILMVPLLLYVVLLQSEAQINIQESYIGRIVSVMTNIHSFEDFINIEPSLATRASSYINEFYLFLKHPIFGIGIGNVKNHIYDQYIQSPVPLTPEMISRTLTTIRFNLEPKHMPGFIYTLLAEHGVFVVCIYIYFFYKLYTTLLLYKSNSFFNRCLVKSLSVSLICFFFLWFYELNIISTYLNLVIALSCNYIYFCKIEKIRRSTHEYK